MLRRTIPTVEESRALPTLRRSGIQGPDGVLARCDGRHSMSYVERDGIWHIVARTEDAETVTVCDLRIVQQTYLWEREPSPVWSRCKAG